MKASYSNLIIKQLISQNPELFVERLALALGQVNYTGDQIMDALIEGVISDISLNNFSDFEKWINSIRDKNPSLTIEIEEFQMNGLNDWILPYSVKGTCYTRGQYEDPVKSGSSAEETEVYKYARSYHGNTGYFTMQELGDLVYIRKV